MNSSTDRNIIKFYLGEETHPVIDNSKERLNHSIFKNQIEKAIDIIKEKIRTIKDKKDSNVVIKHNYSNNIISFIGERGSGKTSCMYSVLENLKKENPSDSDECKKKIKILQPLDPSFFDDTHNILEVFIGEIFNDAIEFIKELKDKKTEAHELMRQFENVKRDMHYLDKETLFERDDELDELEYLSSGINLERSIETLINSYLKLIGSNFLIISVDDIDLNAKQAYSMVEQIRKYLVLPNVVILFAVKIDQLANVIENSLIGDFRNALDKGVISTSSIYEMSERYLNKFLPINNRIYLPNTEALFENKINISKYHEGKEEILEEWDSVKNGVTKLIAEKCGYKFFNAKGKTNEIVPRNLRDLRLLIFLLWNMKIEDQIHNRKIFKNYLFTSWIEHLDHEEKTIARMLLKESEPTLFNKTVVRLLYNHIAKTEKEKESINDVLKIIDSENLPYNISLGDAFYVINYFRDRETSVSIRRLLFFIKALYTIKLTEYYEEIKDTYFTEQYKNNFPRETLDDISNYEKLIGGNFFYLKGDTILAKELREFEREIRLINGNKLFDYIKDIKSSYDKNDGFLNVDKVSILNAVEFFMLSISQYIRKKDRNENIDISKAKDYRLYDDVYYCRKITSGTKNLVFNFLTPIFSCIDIKRVYYRFDPKILEIAQNTNESLYKKIVESDMRPIFYSNINSSEIIDNYFMYIKRDRDSSTSDNIELFRKKYTYISNYDIPTYKELLNSLKLIKTFSELLNPNNEDFLNCFNKIYPKNGDRIIAAYNAIRYYYGSFFMEYISQKVSISKLKKILTDDVYFEQLKHHNGKISKKDIKDIITTYTTVRGLKELENVDFANILLQVMLKYNIFVQENQMVDDRDYESIFNIDTLIEQSEKSEFDEVD